MTWSIEAVSTTADDWKLGPDEEPMRPTYQKLEGENMGIPVIASLSVVAGGTTSGSASLIAAWGEQDEKYRQQLRYSVSGTEKRQRVDIPRGQTDYTVTGLLDGTAYEFQIRNTRSGRVGPWSPSVVITAIANTTPPPALLRFVAAGQSAQATIDFDTPNSPLYAATRVYRATGSNVFANAVLVQTVYGSPNVSDGWTDAPLAAGSYTYWGQPINASGVAGPLSARRTVTVL